MNKFEPKIFKTRISPPFNSTGFRENVFLIFHKAGTAADKKQRRSCQLHAAQEKNSAEITPSKPERSQELHFSVS
jgi:hypothetical protein